MKKYFQILIVSFFVMISSGLFAQNYYENQWKIIRENEKKGLRKSNLPLISELQNRAMKENNTVELIRTLQAEFSILNMTDDDENNNAASRFFAEIQEKGSALKDGDALFFRALSLGFIEEYLRNNIWKIIPRTNVGSADLSSIETWSRQDFETYLREKYAELDANRAQMKNLQFARYRTVFTNSKYSEYFQTVFDWHLTEKISFLGNPDLFTKNELKENQKEISRLYDELINGNTGNAKLYFGHQKILNECRQVRCKDLLEQLKKLAQQNTSSEYTVLIYEDIVQELIRKNRQQEALDVIKKMQLSFPKSPFLNNLKNLENRILQSTLVVNMEGQMQPNMPIHFVATYKNITEFSLNIYKIDDASVFLKRMYNGNTILNKKLFRTEEFKITAPADFQEHKSSLALQALPTGLYFAEIAADPVKNSGRTAPIYFTVSENTVIDFSQAIMPNEKNKYQLLNSETGAMVPHESLVFYELTNGKTVIPRQNKTNENGIFSFPENDKEKYYRNLLVFQPKSGSYQWMSKYGNRDLSYSSETDEKVRSQIFTDRAIYRPGQTVYYKVILTQITDGKETVKPNFKQKIGLFDVNQQEISAQEKTSSEYGSFHGSFVLPKGKLNGSYSLKIIGSESFTKYIRVEEYKRPKFQVEFEPVKNEYKYGETLQLKGKVTMFSGVPVSKTHVAYEIKKQNLRAFYFPWYKDDLGEENSVLGETETDENGNFVLNVKLEKDALKEGIQIDNFAVSASVTDISGETQSAETSVRVASVSHLINAENVKNQFTDERIHIKVQTENYSGQPLGKPYFVKLTKLKSPERILRNTFKTEIQDVPQLTKPEFVQKFPHDANSEKDWKSVPEKILINAAVKKDSLLDLGLLPEGKYELELYNIEGKDTIRAKQEFSVFSKKSLEKERNMFLEIVAPKLAVQKGKTAEIFAYSSVPDARALVIVQDGKNAVQSFNRNFVKGVLNVDVKTPTDEQISQLQITIKMVAYNDVATETVNVQLHNTKQDLTVETVTFRDKLEPGRKEKWTVKVRGSGQEKINAEVLANMYDMSLDQFSPHRFIWSKNNTSAVHFLDFSEYKSLLQGSYSRAMSYLPNFDVRLPEFYWFRNWIIESEISYTSAAPMVVSGKVAGVRVTAKSESVQLQSVADSDEVMNYREIKSEETNSAATTIESQKNDIKIRQNLTETAFFYPELRTDEHGNINFEFTSPEALTKWKMMFLAHTKDAQTAVLEKEVITQKDFSVTPNYPRFLRENDVLDFQSKISNISNLQMNGLARLQILDAVTNEDITAQFNLNNSAQNFNLNAKENTAVAWKINVPKNIASVIFKVSAQAGQYSDGEQQAIAVLPNRMLVTEAVPVFVKEGQTKTFVLDHLKNADSSTISNVSNTLELTTNPIWEILFALPSLKEDPNNSADVVFNRWFADVLAAEIFRTHPKLKIIFEEYQNKGLLISNLEKNQELKQLLLDETPWVLESKNEAEQMARMALLFDANTMKNSIQQDWEMLEKMQNPDGGFSWYQGYPSSYSTSLYILKNLGKLNVWLKENAAQYQSGQQSVLVQNLVKYLDTAINKHYQKSDETWTNWSLDYLDARQYWEKMHPLSGKGLALKNAVKQRASSAKITDFTFFGLHRAAILFNSYGQKNVSDKLMTYLKETSVESEKQGAYWKQNLNDWGWFSSKVVNHAGALEAFSTLKPTDQNFIEELKIWLITQKEVNGWGSSRGTAEVIFTILNSGKSWTSGESDRATVVWGNKELKPQTQATGYIKSSVQNSEINRSLATVTVTKPGAGIVQGGLFWQYYEDLNKIKSSENYVSVSKELYRKIKTENGEQLQKISEKTPIAVGDKVTVRMILNTDRAMQYVHLKDMRAAGFEPVDALSGYHWKNGLGFYQSMKDASTNFYIEFMPKGKYVFEYDIIANASGIFSNGITSLQNYYAPQLSSHTQGSTVMIVPQ